MRRPIFTLRIFLIVGLCVLSGCSSAKESIKISDVQTMQIFVPSKLGTSSYDIKKVDVETTILNLVNNASVISFSAPKGTIPDMKTSAYFEEPFGTTTLLILGKSHAFSYSPTYYLYLYPNGHYKTQLVKNVITVFETTKGKSGSDSYHLQSKALFNWLTNKKEWIAATR